MENVDEWRGHLITRLKQYVTINDIQMTASNAISNSDINAHFFLSVSARLDHFAERINQQDQIIAENSKKIQSLACSLDQFKITTAAQLLLINDQPKVLSDVPTHAINPQHPTVPCVTLGLEQEEVFEGLHGKVKGLEQWIQTEGYAFEGLREMVVGLQEKMDSSLGTSVTSQSNTSGSVPVGLIDLARERDVIRKGI